MDAPDATTWRQDVAQEKLLQIVDLMAVRLAILNAARVFAVVLACLIVTLTKAERRYSNSIPQSVA